MYAVIFTSKLSADTDRYAETTERMLELCSEQPGFVSAESVRDPDGRGMTVCRWTSLEAIRAWAEHPEHLAAQQEGRTRFYEEFDTTICEIL